MRMVVVDLEMLQPGDEICEIGAVLVCLGTGEIEDRFQTYCNPGVPVTDYKLRGDITITDLTGITQETLDNAPSRKEALEAFWQWVLDCQCGRRLAAWGAGDVKCLIKQSQEEGVRYPTRIKNWDIKMLGGLFRNALPKTKAMGGLDNTLKLFGMTFDGTPHRALDDAENTALLLIRFYAMIKNIVQIERMICGG